MTPEERRETFARFIEAVEEGQSIKEACKTARVAWGSLNRWLADTTNTTEGGEPYASRYARARVTSAEGFADRAVKAANDATIEDVQVRRLQVDVYKWRAAMANPKAWGDRQSVDVSGTVHHIPSPQERDARLATIIARAQVVDAQDVTLLPPPPTPSPD